MDPRLDGVFLDWDVLSNTQMATYDATVHGFHVRVPSPLLSAGGSLGAVHWGRGGVAVEAPQVLSQAFLWDGSSSRISDITYCRG